MDYFHLIFNECLIHISACFAVGLLVSNSYFLKVLNLYSSIHQPFIEFLSYAQTTWGTEDTVMNKADHMLVFIGDENKYP